MRTALFLRSSAGTRLLSPLIYLILLWLMNPKNGGAHKAICCRWTLLDFALLKRSSVSFFDVEQPESVVSRWSRARARAAKVEEFPTNQRNLILAYPMRSQSYRTWNILQVGKGLSKDEKAKKLALQHWLEAVSWTKKNRKISAFCIVLISVAD